MYTIKVLTHVIRLSDGHVMPDWIDAPKGSLTGESIRKDVCNGKYDCETHAVRIGRKKFIQEYKN